MNSSSEELLRLATRIRSAGLRDVALFLLEAHRPLAGLFAHLAHFIAPAFPGQRSTFELLTDGQHLDELARLLESEH